MPLFEKLVKLDSIDASSVSDGEPGEFYGLWLEFSKLAGPSDFERLALDPQPLARAMGWLGLAQQSNERSTALIVARVHDREPVRHCPGGCTCFTIPLGGFARALLVDAWHLDGSATQRHPLLTEAQLRAIDLEILATDEIASLQFFASYELTEAIEKGQLKLELSHVMELGTFRKLSPMQVIKAVGRISREPRPGYPTLGFLVHSLHDAALEPRARLAAASALTRFEDIEAERAIERERAFLDSAGPEPLGARFAAEIRLRRQQTRLMKPIRDADWIWQTEPLADRALEAFQTDHPMVFGDLESTGSFGKHDARVHAARAATLLRMVKRHPEFAQPWNTYADVIYGIDWLVRRDAIQAMIREDQVTAVRAAIENVLPSLQGG